MRVLGARRFATLAVALLLAVGVMAAVPASKAAAAGCSPTNWGYICDGTSPQATGCSVGAISYGGITDFGDLKVELRYSPKCHTAWTRVTNDRASHAAGYQGTSILRENGPRPIQYDAASNCKSFCIDWVAYGGTSYGYQVYWPYPPETTGILVQAIGYLCSDYLCNNVTDEGIIGTNPN